MGYFSIYLKIHRTVKMKTCHLRNKQNGQKLLCKFSSKAEETFIIVVRNWKDAHNIYHEKNSPSEDSKDYRAFTLSISEGTPYLKCEAVG